MTKDKAPPSAELCEPNYVTKVIVLDGVEVTVTVSVPPPDNQDAAKFIAENGDSWVTVSNRIESMKRELEQAYERMEWMLNFVRGTDELAEFKRSWFDSDGKAIRGLSDE
jgi:hypothetical protein